MKVPSVLHACADPDEHYNCSPLSHGECWGLEFLTSLSDNDYEWARIDVWLHTSGAVLWSTDSGCSCNGPYEDAPKFYVLEDKTWPDLEAAADTMVLTRGVDHYERASFLYTARRRWIEATTPGEHVKLGKELKVGDDLRFLGEHYPITSIDDGVVRSGDWSMRIDPEGWYPIRKESA